MRIYPGKDEEKLLVDPPVELRYFYAARVPGSQSGAALFLKEDDRVHHRYIFRFEFQNCAVSQSPARVYQFVHSGETAKMLQRQEWVSKKVALIKSPEKEEEKIRVGEESQQVHTAYLKSVSDIVREGQQAVDTFVGLVNSAVSDDGIWRRRHSTSWGAGYQDGFVGHASDADDSSDWSSDKSSLYDEDSDDDITIGEAGEMIHHSLERMFHPIAKKISET